MMANLGSRFLHAGLAFGAGWASYDVAAMSDAQRATVDKYLGRFIRVHPADEKKLRALLEAAPENDNAEPDTPGDAIGEPGTAGDVSSEYAGMTITDLRKLASELDVELPSTVRRKADIIKVLEEATRS